MSDMIGFGVALAVVFGAIAAFAAYHVYRGVHGDLTNAKIGEVYNFKYEQPLHGQPERYMAKVLAVHVLDDAAIRRLNARSNYRRYDGNFIRTPHLVTAQSYDGTVRNFYAERTSDVRRPLLGGVVFKTGLASLLF